MFCGFVGGLLSFPSIQLRRAFKLKLYKTPSPECLTLPGTFTSKVVQKDSFAVLVSADQCWHNKYCRRLTPTLYCAGPVVLRAAPCNMVTFGVYELVLHLLGGHDDVLG